MLIRYKQAPTDRRSHSAVYGRKPLELLGGDACPSPPIGFISGPVGKLTQMLISLVVRLRPGLGLAIFRAVQLCRMNRNLGSPDAASAGVFILGHELGDLIAVAQRDLLLNPPVDLVLGPAHGLLR